MAKKQETKVKLTKYERTRLVGSRAVQIANGALIRVKLKKEELEAIGYNPIEIAIIELDRGVLPIEVVRPSPKANAAEE
jgi:DNA-directed RNA polymerase subunit K/omega